MTIQARKAAAAKAVSELRRVPQLVNLFALCEQIGRDGGMAYEAFALALAEALRGECPSTRASDIAAVAVNAAEEIKCLLGDIPEDMV